MKSKDVIRERFDNLLKRGILGEVSNKILEKEKRNKK